jgi:hypothetical protein
MYAVALMSLILKMIVPKKLRDPLADVLEIYPAADVDAAPRDAGDF